MKDNLVEKADRLAGITALILILLGVIQIFYGELISKSIALTANGIDCIGDGFVSAVVWVGLMFFQKPANQRFHYGYYKMENLASGFAAIVMIGLAIFIVFRSYTQLLDPRPVETPIIGAILAFVAALIALGLGIYKFRRSKKSKMGSVKLEAFNTIKDGAASGLTVVALILSSLGFYIADGVVGIVIAAIIVTIGFAAIKESSNILVDACDGECIDLSFSIKQVAEEVKGVISARIVRLRKAGPVYQGELEIEVPEDMTIREFNEIKEKIIDHIQEIFPEIDRCTITVLKKDISNKE